MGSPSFFFLYERIDLAGYCRLGFKAGRQPMPAADVYKGAIGESALDLKKATLPDYFSSGGMGGMMGSLSMSSGLILKRS